MARDSYGSMPGVGRRGPRQRSPRIHMVVSFYSALAIVGVLWHGSVTDSNAIWRAPASSFDGSAHWLWIGPLLGLAFGLSMVAAMRWIEPRFSWMVDLRREFAAIFGETPHREVLWIAGASALGEELLFRGAMLDAWGLLPSSLVFALLHLPPRRTLWPWTASAALLGLALGGLTLVTGNLGAAVLAHFIINALNLAYITRAGGHEPR